MDFRFTQEQDDAAELAAQILEDHTTNDRLKAVEADGDRFDRDLWAALGSAGLLGLALPEEYDGAGLGVIELCRVLVEVGRTVAPVPLAAHGPASRLIAELGSDALKQQWLPGAASGATVLTAAVAEERAFSPVRPTTVATPDGSSYVLTGSKAIVPAGPYADAFLVPAETPSGVGVFLVEPGDDGVTVVAQTFSDRDGVARLDLDGAVLPVGRLVGTADGAADQRLRRLLVLAASAEQLGITEGALRLTSTYAKTREQFGRPIGTFQAVSQRLADGYIDVLGQRLTLWQAAWRLEEGLPAESEVAIAKLWAADAGHRLAHTAVHVHGGVGIDLDGETHRYFTSAKRFEFLHGGATEQALNIGRILAAEPGVTALPTVREQLLARAGDDGPGLLFEDESWTWAEVVRESSLRAAAVASLLADGEPPHVGVLLENVPEFAFLLGGAALGGQVLVGLNPTRRGDALAADVRRADVQVVVTDAAHAELLADVDVPVLSIDGPDWAVLLEKHGSAPVPDAEVGPDDLMMLIFTSGTSGDPKAVNVTQSKVAYPGQFLSERFGLGPADVAYLSMPMFHSNAIMAGWGPALAAGSTIALARRFSASGFLPDVRRHGATYANYVGKPLTYIMATPEQPDDADNPLRLVFGNEANDRDIAGFGQRFGCVVVDSYSSTENAVIVQRVPEMPPGSLGRPLEGVEVLDPETMAEVPDAVFDPSGRLENAEAATGELVNTTGSGAFAGYYKDPGAEAERMRGGMYWSGDLAYRDADGFVYFAGRTADWLRVDGENLAAAPIERILLRHPLVEEAAVYAVPDPSVGDQVMAALVVRGSIDPGPFEEFLASQPDLSRKGWPAYVRVVSTLPRTATNKVLKRELAAEGPVAGDGELWTREPRGTSYSA